MRRPTVLPVIVAAAFSLVACDHPAAPNVLKVASSESALTDVGNHGPPGSLVFHSARSGDLEIYRMNPDGTDPVRLTNSPGEDDWPDISPNGRYVAFASTRTGNREIFVLDLADGSLRNVSQSPGDDNWPRWSPNGKQIAFHSNRDGNYEIYVVNADGSSSPRRVTNNPLLDQWPDWSPDGKHIAFRRDFDVFVIDADGEEQNPRRLTNLPTTIDQMPAWSPNGQQIAFMSLREGYCAVFLMSVDGDTPEHPAVNLTPKASGDPSSQWCSRAPAWSRDGQRIYFQSMRPGTGGTADLFVMNADGTGLERLTVSAGEDGGPRVR
jgi:Tol biopolymer transport system component